MPYLAARAYSARQDLGPGFDIIIILYYIFPFLFLKKSGGREARLRQRISRFYILYIIHREHYSIHTRPAAHVRANGIPVARSPARREYILLFLLFARTSSIACRVGRHDPTGKYEGKKDALYC